jgi:hypothetical protein
MPPQPPGAPSWPLAANGDRSVPGCCVYQPGTLPAPTWEWLPQPDAKPANFPCCHGMGGYIGRCLAGAKSNGDIHGNQCDYVLGLHGIPGYAWRRTVRASYGDSGSVIGQVNRRAAGERDNTVPRGHWFNAPSSPLPGSRTRRNRRPKSGRLPLLRRSPSRRGSRATPSEAITVSRQYGAQNSRFWAGLEGRSDSQQTVQNGGYTRVLSLWINHALRLASGAKAAGAAAPRVRA